MADPLSRAKVPKRASFFSKAKTAVHLFYQKANNDKLFDRAANVAFQALFSIIPIIALAYVIFALSSGFARFQDSVEHWAIENLAPNFGDQVIRYLKTIHKNVDPKAIGIFGVLGFLWAGISMISKAETAMNGLWGLTRTRPLGRRVWMYSVALIVAPVLLGLSFAATSYFAARTEGYRTIHTATVVILAIVPWLISATFFTFTYWALPYTRVSKRAALKSGLITAVVFELLKQGYAFYAAHIIGHSIYGSLAALPILFLWVSLSATIFMLGAELCYFLDMHEQGIVHVARLESHLSFPLLVDILRIFQRKAGAPYSVKKVVHDLEWDQSEVFSHVHYLAELKLLRLPKGHAVGDECYEAIELNLEAALDKLLAVTNRIKYEKLEVPHSSLPSTNATKPTPVRERGPVLVDLHL